MFDNDRDTGTQRCNDAQELLNCSNTTVIRKMYQI